MRESELRQVKILVGFLGTCREENAEVRYVPKAVQHMNVALSDIVTVMCTLSLGNVWGTEQQE